MLIDSMRDTFTEISTTSMATLDGVAPFVILELPREYNGKRNIPNKTCILPGLYSLRLRWSENNNLWVPELYIPGAPDIHGRSEIEIHPANEPHQIRGCLAPGLIRRVDRVESSKIVFDQIMHAMIDAIRRREPAQIHIREAA